MVDDPLIFSQSVCSLPYDRSTTASKTSSHTLRSIASSFTLQYILFLLNVIQYPLTPSSSSFHHYYRTIFASVTCLKMHFLCMMWPIQLAFTSFIVCRSFIYSSIQRHTLSFLTRSLQLNFRIQIFNCCYNPVSRYIVILSINVIVCVCEYSICWTPLYHYFF